jgi:hypothetical protein
MATKGPVTVALLWAAASARIQTSMSNSATPRGCALHSTAGSCHVIGININASVQRVGGVHG